MHNSIFDSQPVLKQRFATHLLKYDKNNSHYKVHLCKSSDEHIELLRNCYSNKIHFQTGSYQNLNKFEQIWKLVLGLGAQNEFKQFFKDLGDNKEIPLLFASTFFNCHTQETINFIESSVGDNTNLQKRHPLSFAYDIITGWIPEFILAEYFDLEKSGCDSDYKLQKGKNINGAEDFKLGDQGIELAMDYTDLIRKENIFNLRYNKWKNIQKPNSNLLVICTKSWRYYIHPVSFYKEKIHAKYKDRIEQWSRKDNDVKGYELSGWNNLKPNTLTKSNLSNSFNEIKTKNCEKFPSGVQINSGLYTFN